MTPEQVKAPSREAPHDWLDRVRSAERAAGTEADLLRILRTSQDEAELRQAAAEYLLIATAASTDPARDAAARAEELVALRPGDAAYRLVVLNIRSTLTKLWRSLISRPAPIATGASCASSSRSAWKRSAVLPDGQDSLDYQYYEWILGSSSEAGTPPLLSLAIADRLLQRGNTEQADDLAEFVAVGVRGQEERLIESVDRLSETLMPLFTPMQWDAFLSEEGDDFELPSLQALGEHWLNDNPEIEEEVNERLEEINEQVFWLNRSRGHLDEYAPRFEELEGHEERVELAHADDSQEEAPQIAFASHLSPAAAIDNGPGSEPPAPRGDRAFGLERYVRTGSIGDGIGALQRGLSDRGRCGPRHRRGARSQ